MKLKSEAGNKYQTQPLWYAMWVDVLSGILTFMLNSCHLKALFQVSTSSLVNDTTEISPCKTTNPPSEIIPTYHLAASLITRVKFQHNNDWIGHKKRGAILKELQGARILIAEARGLASQYAWSIPVCLINSCTVNSLSWKQSLRTQDLIPGMHPKGWGKLTNKMAFKNLEESRSHVEWTSNATTEKEFWEMYYEMRSKYQ